MTERQTDRRVYISLKAAEIDDKFRNGNFLNFGSCENKDRFLFAFAMGIGEPETEIGQRKQMFQWYTLKNKGESCLRTYMLHMDPDNRHLDEYLKPDNVAAFAEKVAESGYDRLNRLYLKNDSNIELMEKELFAELDDLYDKAINSDM